MREGGAKVLQAKPNWLLEWLTTCPRHRQRRLLFDVVAEIPDADDAPGHGPFVRGFEPGFPFCLVHLPLTSKRKVFGEKGSECPPAAKNTDKRKPNCQNAEGG